MTTKENQKSFYDRTAQQLPLLSTNDTARIESPKQDNQDKSHCPSRSSSTVIYSEDRGWTDL